jgi:CRP-like cAMP-binding protein
MELAASRNLLLRQLSPADRERLAPHLQPVPLAFRQTLFEQGEEIAHVYFVESGVVSLVTDLEGGETIETGTVGNEGLAGIPAVLGVRRAPGRAFCQVPGSGWRVAEAVIAAERERASAWFGVLLRYVSFATAMTAQSAACNRLHTVDARMSRWLLMTHDRVGGDDIPLTQEFLAEMLGVARPTVNIAGATLQKAGFIRYARGRITVLDRAGLESAACECYQRIRQELLETLGEPDVKNGRERTRPEAAAPTATASYRSPER